MTRATHGTKWGYNIKVQVNCKCNGNGNNYWCDRSWLNYHFQLQLEMKLWKPEMHCSWGPSHSNKISRKALGQTLLILLYFMLLDSMFTTSIALVFASFALAQDYPNSSSISMLFFSITVKCLRLPLHLALDSKAGENTVTVTKTLTFFTTGILYTTTSQSTYTSMFLFVNGYDFLNLRIYGSFCSRESDHQ